MIYQGDCLEVLRTLESNSLDSMVTDPPAGIGFMGREWDSDKGGREAWVSWMTVVMTEALRVLKPGGHALVWAIPRTSHWTMTALENAGFEIRDVITHLFGTGFPKSMCVSKAIAKAAAAERKIVGPTPDAEKWRGFGTALKPAAEFWVLCRKPLGEKTVAANVLKHGTGALNIDGCRIGTDELTPRHNHGGRKDINVGEFGVNGADFVATPSPLGRFPADLVLSHSEGCKLVGTKKVKPGNGSGRTGAGANGFRSTYVGGEKKADGFTGDYVDADGTETVEAWECEPDCAVRMLDEQSGERPSGSRKAGVRKGLGFYGADGDGGPAIEGSTGGASRFFYCAKASRSDRGAGNTHPTVKASKLMSYLCRLVTPPRGAVLDPFMGSGSTGVAAKAEGFGFVGIEQNPDYFVIAASRIA